jgi:hypothetical protein
VAPGRPIQYANTTFQLTDGHAPAVCTSPLQTYLDLEPAKGSAAEAAEIIFDRHIRPPDTLRWPLVSKRKPRGFCNAGGGT